MPVGFKRPSLILDVRILVHSITSSRVYQQDLITREELSLCTTFWQISLLSCDDLNEILVSSSNLIYLHLLIKFGALA